MLVCKSGLQPASANAIKPMDISSSYRCAVMQQQSTAALFRATCTPSFSVLLCKTGSKHACAISATEALQHWSGINAIPAVQCCSAKQAHSMLCVTANTPMEICSSYRCAVMHHQTIAALFWTTCIPDCSVLLCKTGSKHACAISVTPIES